jgi:hypothetical protein
MAGAPVQSLIECVKLAAPGVAYASHRRVPQHQAVQRRADVSPP